MDIKDLLNQELTQEQIEEQMIRQGAQVLEIVAHPGWQIVLSHLGAAKANEERRRAGKLSQEPNAHKALYFSGRVDGINEAIETINRVITDADQVRKNKMLNKGDL